MSVMKSTHLYQEHQKLNAKMISFAGFKMPISYSGVKEEYWATRKKTGLFDISHMSPILVKSKINGEIIRYLNHITCRDLKNLKPSQVQYNALVNNKGGIVDDITIYMLNSSLFMLIVNASNKESVIEHLQKYQDKFSYSCKIYPLEEYILLALQGPLSESIMTTIKTITYQLNQLYYYECTLLNSKVKNVPYVISRTGYTGEDGFEVLLPKKSGLLLWKEMISLGAQPCGLASRDLLRMEVFYPLYGKELTIDKTPAESGIGWLVSSNKTFIGKDRILLEKNKPTKKTKGFQLLEEGIPRTGYEIFTSDKKKVGIVTSGSYSFQWKKGFGIAYLDATYANDQQELFLKIRDQNKRIRVLSKSPHKGSIQKRPC